MQFDIELGYAGIMVERNVSGWRVRDGEFVEDASRHTTCTDVSVNVDGTNGDMEVRIDEGYGYLSQSCSCTIPFDVVCAVFAKHGYTISKNSSTDECNSR